MIYIYIIVGADAKHAAYVRVYVGVGVCGVLAGGKPQGQRECVRGRRTCLKSARQKQLRTMISYIFACMYTHTYVYAFMLHI
jgi:hypothetical protein